MKYHFSFHSLLFVPLLTLFVLAYNAHGYQNDRYWSKLRAEMVEVAVKKAGVKDPRVLKSVAETRRHEFVPRNMLDRAYLDAGVPIGFKQTISSPFICLLYTSPSPRDKRQSRMPSSA